MIKVNRVEADLTTAVGTEFMLRWMLEMVVAGAEAIVVANTVTTASVAFALHRAIQQ